jgi:integrase
MKHTSITDKACRDFIAKARERDQFGCKRIAGFYLMKTKTGASWRYRYTDNAGKRRVYTIGQYPAKTPEQAAQEALDFRNRKADPVFETKEKRRKAVTEQEAAKNRTLYKYMIGPYTEFQSRKKDGGKHNLEFLRQNFKHLYDRDLASLTEKDIHQWQAKREAEGRAYVSIRRAFAQIKHLVKHAHENGYLAENPLQKVRLKPITTAEKARIEAPEHKAARRLLTKDELAGIQHGLEQFAEEIRRRRRNSRKHGKTDLPDLDKVALPHWFIPFCQLALHTGMRPGDLHTLTWTELNVNFKRLEKTPVKTLHHENPPRLSLPLNAAITDIMKKWWEQQGKPLDGLVFPSPVTGGLLDKKAHIKPWRNVKRLGGVDDSLSFYSLRHHFISRLVSDNVPLLTVAKLVGHKSATMIEQHYSHLCPTQAADVMSAYAATLTGKALAEGN